MVSAFQLGLILTVALGSTTYGYCSSIIATTLTQPSFIHYFHLDTAPNANSLIGAINGLFQAGGLFGSISSLWIPDKWGRKIALYVGGFICILGCALQTGSVHIAMFLVARLVTGFGIGALVGLVPLYQSEVSPTNIRGFLVGLHGVMICIGYASASWVGVGFYFVQGTLSQWRGPLAFQVLFPLILVSALSFVPESPRWLITMGRKDDALKAFSKVHNSGVKVRTQQHEITLQEEFRLLVAQTTQEMREHVPLRDFFIIPSLRKRCLIGFATMFAAQGTFILVINNYGSILYAGLGFGTTQQLLIQAGWICLCPPGNLLNAFIVDRVGRVRLLIFGFCGTVTALVGECGALVSYKKTSSRATAAVAVFFLFWHITMFCVSVDATTYIYTSEIFPTPLRARGIGISITGLFVATLIFLQVAPTAFANITGYYYLVGAGVTTFFAVVAYFLFPETKGLSLEDIAQVFGDNITLDDPEEEAIHRRFRDGHYREIAITQAAEAVHRYHNSSSEEKAVGNKANQID